MEVLFVIFVLVAVVTVAGIAFSIWALSAALRMLVWSVGGAFRSVGRVVVPGGVKREAVPHGQGCSNTACLCNNPVHARFCRRCGRALPALMRLVETRAA